MQTVTINHNNGHSTTYKIFYGTAYHNETPQELMETLERLRNSKTRIKIYYGDAETGKDWNEEYNTTGTIGRSTGTVKIPLLIANSRSSGGGAILDHCIVKIKRISDGAIFYQHPTYQPPQVEIKPSEEPGYNFSLIVNGTTYSNHKTERQAKLLKTKLL